MFKSYTEYIKLNEALDKFVLRPKDPKTPNGEQAFVIKYKGQNFDKSLLTAFLNSKPETKSMVDKVRTQGDRYFIAYETRAEAEEQMIGNKKVWSAYLELIDSQKTGTPAFVGFNKAPYNNFVPIANLDNVKNPDSAGSVVDTVETEVQQAAQAEIKAEANVQVSTELKPEQTEVGITPNVGGATTRTVDVAPAIQTESSKFEGLKLNTKGELAVFLQRAIEHIATAKKNTEALNINNQNVKSSGVYDGNFGPWTQKALSAVLGIPVGDTITPEVAQKIQSELSAAGITYEALVNKTPNEKPKAAPQGTTQPKPTAQAGATPAAQTVATNTNTTSPQQGRDFVEANMDGKPAKIYFA
jgi:hypothetical protein